MQFINVMITKAQAELLLPIVDMAVGSLVDNDYWVIEPQDAADIKTSVKQLENLKEQLIARLQGQRSLI